MPTPIPPSITTFTTTQLTLLAAELAAETAQSTALLASTAPSALARAGLALTNLTLASQRTGLGGRIVLELEPDSAVAGAEGELPEHGLRVGDIVAVQAQPAGAARKKEKAESRERGVEGVVCRVQAKSVHVALEGDEVEVPGGKLWIVKVANDVTYKRMTYTMKDMNRLSEAAYTPVMRVAFGLSSTSPVPSDVPVPTWLDPTLNASQKEAIAFALASREVALIHGPPGTGKTHTLIELILQLVQRNQRVLVCGPSNISVDNIVERLARHKVPLVRLGHPARLLPGVVAHSLEVLTRTSDAAAIVADIRKEMDAKQASLKKTRNGRERRAVYGELRELRKEFREREKRCVREIVAGSKVVLATLHGAGGFHLKGEKFDVVVIDEASQALEAQCWVPLIGAGKVVLAGDHLQLPPTIKSLNMKETEPKGAKGKEEKGKKEKGITLETTLFDRLLALHGSSIKRMLTTQYRMHEKIMAFPSQELYESKLVAADAVKAWLLKDLPFVDDTDDTREPLVFWDTQGGDFAEKDEDDTQATTLLGDSKSNEGEAALARLHVARLVEAGVSPADIAVVTPYNAQLAVLARLLKEAYPGIELGSTLFPLDTCCLGLESPLSSRPHVGTQSTWQR
ncbi:P-loop containing nucleoside triphosphate hydrolase protein [Trichodelitschia bisporula]|uniref:DNA helicase n=1 Tax=Trichodelitschia bisporula TaxID=703511 RepID=A0A6G1HP93_9PEZI|nr:P-loop containing nucleoside triphosphate hydrolase protein [Trichodelitschia bisporula]